MLDSQLPVKVVKTCVKGDLFGELVQAVRGALERDSFTGSGLSPCPKLAPQKLYLKRSTSFSRILIRKCVISVASPSHQDLCQTALFIRVMGCLTSVKSKGLAVQPTVQRIGRSVVRGFGPVVSKALLYNCPRAASVQCREAMKWAALELLESLCIWREMIWKWW